MSNARSGGTFAPITGTASTGSTGLTSSMPAGTQVCYLAAGSNPTCGLRPK